MYLALQGLDEPGLMVTQEGPPSSQRRREMGNRRDMCMTQGLGGVDSVRDVKYINK